MNIVIETKKAEAIALCNSIISDVTKGFECLGTVGALIVALSAIDRLRAVDECNKGRVMK